jgi:hypothetical protein
MSVGRTLSAFSVAISAARARAVGFRPRYFPSAFGLSDALPLAPQYQFALAARQQTPPQAKDPNSRAQGEFRKSR